MEMNKIIKKLRIENNLTQTELGEKLGLQKAAIAKYENGQVENIKRSTIAKMSELFDVSPSYLLGFETESKQEKLELSEQEEAEMEIVDLIIKRIKEIKKENKITNEELAKITGISISTLSKILGNQTKDPSVSNIIKIADALNVSVEYLAYGKEKTVTLNDKETELLHKYNNLDAQGKKNVDLILNSEYERIIEMALKSRKSS